MSPAAVALDHGGAMDEVASDDFVLIQNRLPLPADSPAGRRASGAEPQGDAHTTSWPVLYILTNSKRKTAYIGETTNYRRRMGEHVANPKKDFDRSLLIDSPTFNQSTTFDFENRLIDLFLADESYHVTNLNNGYCAFNYYLRPLYRQKFRTLWQALRSKGYARGTLEELENSDLFKYSPYKSLTPDQYEAIGRILTSVADGRRGCTVISGAPGTGKSILAMSLLLKLKVEADCKSLRVALVCPMDSLRKTLKELARSIEGLHPGDIISPSDATRGEAYDVLLVDEAHRLHGIKGAQGVPAFRAACERVGLPDTADQADWLIARSTKTYFFFDPKQQVRATGLDEKNLESKLDKLADDGVRIDRMALSTQVRVRGGDEYLDFVYNILSGHTDHIAGDEYGRLLRALPTQANEDAPDSDLYQLAIVDSFADFFALQAEKERQVGLSRMVAGYAWEWTSKKDPGGYDIVIDGIGRRWNSKTSNWVNSSKAANEVGCVHTVQGYDLNYGFVIVGDDLRLDGQTGMPSASRRDFHDRGAKRTADEAELLRVVVNAYYVLMTRGMLGTFLYVENPDTKEYLGRFIPTIARDESSGEFRIVRGQKEEI